MFRRIIWLLYFLLIINGCSSDHAGNFEACANNFDPQIIKDSYNPNGYIDVEYNKENDLPLATLHPGITSDIRILTMNVGNGATDLHSVYNLRLAYQDYEDLLGVKISAINPRPSIIAIQEVLNSNQCMRIFESDSNKTCYDKSMDQVQRLLGDEYQIICDGNKGVDCLAVLKSFASIEGLVGDYNASWQQGTASLPPVGGNLEYELCNWTNGECNEDKELCDEESSIAHAYINTHTGQSIHAIFIHPTATGLSCIEAQYKQILDLIDFSEPTLVIGDWNYDPFRLIGRGSVAPLAAQIMDKGEGMVVHNDFDKECTMRKTAPNLLATLDFVVTNFSHGICRTHSDEKGAERWMGPSLGKFDQGILEALFEAETIPRSYEKRRMDHHMVDCSLKTEF